MDPTSLEFWEWFYATGNQGRPLEHAYVMWDGKVARMENKVDRDAWTAAWS